MKRRIILHGYLKKLHPEDLIVEADTVAEALRSLEHVECLQREDGTPHLVEVDGISSDIALFSKSTIVDIHVRPVMGGAGGRGGLMQVLIGIVLISLAIVFPAGIVLSSSLTIGTSGFMLTGAMMALGGIIQMLTPVPENNTTEANKYLGSGGNTVEIGTRIPLIYGTRKAYGHYLSFDVDAVETGTGPAIGAVAPTPIVQWDPYYGILAGSNPAATTDANFHKYDVTTLPAPIAPVRPVYASAATSPTSYPIDYWSPV